jgi:hypothetical protein
MMSPREQYCFQIGRLKLTSAQAAWLCGVDERSERRWRAGDRQPPAAVYQLLTACERFPTLLDHFLKGMPAEAR